MSLREKSLGCKVLGQTPSLYRKVFAMRFLLPVLLVALVGCSSSPTAPVPVSLDSYQGTYQFAPSEYLSYTFSFNEGFYRISEHNLNKTHYIDLRVLKTIVEDSNLTVIALLTHYSEHFGETSSESIWELEDGTIKVNGSGPYVLRKVY